MGNVIENLARYLYLPAHSAFPNVPLRGQSRKGLRCYCSWFEESVYLTQTGYDEATDRYRGLRCGQQVSVFPATNRGLLVRPERGIKQQEADAALAAANAGRHGARRGQPGGGSPTGRTGSTTPPDPKSEAVHPKRYHGAVVLDSARVGRDASRVADEVISHLAGLVGAKVKVTLEIEATIPDGASEQVMRTVTENGRTLRFSSQGFETD